MTPNHSSRSQLFTLFLLIFIDSLNFFLALPVLAKIFSANDYHLLATSLTGTQRDLLYSLAIMVSPLAFLISSPFIGNLSDRFGRKKTLLGCLLAAALGYALTIVGIISKSLTGIYLGRMIAGGATASQPVAQAAITDFTNGKQKAFYLSLIGFAMTLAMVLGPMMGSFLSDANLMPWFNAMTPFGFGAILSIINILLLMVFFKETNVHERTLSPRVSWKILCEILLRSTISRLLFMFLLLEASWSEYYQILFLYLPQQHHYTSEQTSLFAAYIGLWMSLGLTFIYRYLIRRFTLKQIAHVSLWTISIGLIGSSLFASSFALWFLVIFIAIFTGTGYAALLALISNNASSHHQGWALGVASTLLGIAWAVTAPLGSALLHLQIALPFWVAALLITFALALFQSPSAKLIHE